MMSLSEEEKRERKKIANKKYRSTLNGKKKTNEAKNRYNTTDKNKIVQERYYQKNK